MSTIWSQLHTIYIPGLRNVNASTFLLTIGYVTFSIAIFNRLTGTEGLGIMSGFVSKTAGAGNATIQKGKQEYQKWKVAKKKRENKERLAKMRQK